MYDLMKLNHNADGVRKEHGMNDIELSLDDPERLRLIARALGSDVRIRIMQMLDERSMNIEELSQEISVPISTVSNNVVVLEEAGLVRTERQNGIRGVMKLCSRNTDSVTISLTRQAERDVQTFCQQMPIGHYVDCRVEPVCGLLGRSGAIGDQDDQMSFYDPDHVNAQLLWFRRGYVEYRFSNQMLRQHNAKSLEISFEACSEAPNYQKDWLSDITVWINGVEIGTWQCPGDFGGRLGRYSPDWWPLNMTQYGLFKRWRVDENGCTLDDALISGVTLDQLKLDEQPFISVRIGIRDDAQYPGGINLFGEEFGDYNQPIIMKLDCLKKTDNTKGDDHHESAHQI